jgi:hypothetical protein
VRHALGGTWIRIIRKLACLASDLEADPCQRYDLEGQDGGDQFETSAAPDKQMNWWVTGADRRKDYSDAAQWNGAKGGSGREAKLTSKNARHPGVSRLEMS